MKRTTFFRIMAFVTLLAVLAGVAFVAYQAGTMRGAGLDVSEISKWRADSRGEYVMPHMFFFGGPLLLLRCLVPLFLLFLFFGALRFLFWGGPLRHHGPWMGDPWRRHPEEGVPAMFDEWHRRAHEKPQEPPAADKS